MEWQFPPLWTLKRATGWWYFFQFPGNLHVDVGITDDMIIYSANEHNENFLNFIEKCEQQPHSQCREDPVQGITDIFL